jgi:hypothetical protein
LYLLHFINIFSKFPPSFVAQECLLIAGVFAHR